MSETNVFGVAGSWSVIDGQWVTPGWYRRTPTGAVRLHGWRYIRHRILWGTQRLVDARHPTAGDRGSLRARLTQATVVAEEVQP